MCFKNYFTKADVEQVAESIANDSDTKTHILAISDLVEELGQHAAVAGMLASVSTGNPAKVLAGIFAAGVEVGIRLSGAEDRIPPVSEERAADFHAKLAEYENAKAWASIPSETFQSAAHA